MTGRDAFFATVRQALGRAPGDGPPDDAALLPDAGALDERVAAIVEDCRQRSAELMAALEESSARAGCVVRRVESPAEAGRYAAAVAADHSARAVVRTAHPVLDEIGLPEALQGRGIELFGPDGGRGDRAGPGRAEREALRERTLEAAVGVTGVDYAVAETGSAVIVARPGVARLASLLPPVHVAVVTSGQVLPGLDELFVLRRRDMLRRPGRDYMNVISGPSRSADIEYTLVTGVHGPGEVHVVLVQ